MIATRYAEPLAIWDIGQIRCPHLVRTVYVQAFQQVRGNLLPLTQPAGVRLRIEGSNPHLPHQALNPFAVHRETLIV